MENNDGCSSFVTLIVLVIVLIICVYHAFGGQLITSEMLDTKISDLTVFDLAVITFITSCLARN